MKTALPEFWRDELDHVLIEPRQIQNRVAALATEIQHDYSGRELVIVALLSGTIMFLADLIRHLELPLRLDFMGISSYRQGAISESLQITKELKLDVRGRDVLIVDDILDTGRTLQKVIAKLQELKPRSLKSCVLLDKTSRRVEPIHPDYAGFEIPDLFVVGYGMDFAERYRNLPFVGVLKEHIYTQS